MSEFKRIVVARRRLIAGAASASVLAALGAGRAAAAAVGSAAALGYEEIPDGALAEQMLTRCPARLPLIKKTYRPPISRRRRSTSGLSSRPTTRSSCGGISPASPK